MALTTNEKIEKIKKLCSNHYITAFEISKNADVSDVGVTNILNGNSKNPRAKTLDSILNYLNTKTPGIDKKIKKKAGTDTEMHNETLQAIKDLEKKISDKINSLFTEEIIEKIKCHDNVIKEIQKILLKNNILNLFAGFIIF